VSESFDLWERSTKKGSTAFQSKKLQFLVTLLKTLIMFLLVYFMHKELIVRQVNHHRKRDRPKKPTKVRFKIDKDFLSSRTTNFFQKTVKVGKQGHWIFFTLA
jgi:zona occludens toxin (predicted ATPase)